MAAVAFQGAHGQLANGNCEISRQRHPTVCNTTNLPTCTCHCEAFCKEAVSMVKTVCLITISVMLFVGKNWPRPVLYWTLLRRYARYDRCGWLCLMFLDCPWPLDSARWWFYIVTHNYHATQRIISHRGWGGKFCVIEPGWWDLFPLSRYSHDQIPTAVDLMDVDTPTLNYSQFGERVC
jgi:hypothetical protein